MLINAYLNADFLKFHKAGKPCASDYGWCTALLENHASNGRVGTNQQHYFTFATLALTNNQLDCMALSVRALFSK